MAPILWFIWSLRIHLNPPSVSPIVVLGCIYDSNGCGFQVGYKYLTTT